MEGQLPASPRIGAHRRESLAKMAAAAAAAGQLGGPSRGLARAGLLLLRRFGGWGPPRFVSTWGHWRAFPKGE